MASASKLKVILLALTGFGNPVMNALVHDDRVTLSAVFTRSYDQAFPYYPEIQLMDLCQERRVTCYADVKLSSEEGIALLDKHDPELIIVSTFSQILSQRVLNLPRLGVVNLHPSLLPKYRGPCPTQAALLHDEPFTGVTAHYVTERLDEGDILLQRSIAIEETDNDGRLRRKLAGLSGEITPVLIDKFAANLRPTGTPQDHRQASAAPRSAVEDGYLELAGDIRMVRNKVRAYNPLPGTSILVGNSRVPIERSELLPDGGKDGLYEQDTFVDLIVNSEAIRLFKRIERGSNV